MDGPPLKQYFALKAWVHGATSGSLQKEMICVYDKYLTEKEAREDVKRIMIDGVWHKGMFYPPQSFICFWVEKIYSSELVEKMEEHQRYEMSILWN